MIKYRPILLPLIVSLFLLTSNHANAQNSATVTDNGAPHSPIVRYDQFETGLSVTVANPPESDQETTITGPTYDWSTRSGFTVTTGSPEATLSSSNVSPTYLTPSQNNVGVYCTVTYTSTNNATQVATPIVFSGYVDVQFFVLSPIFIQNNGDTPNSTTIPGATSPYNGNNVAGRYGHLDGYSLTILDNESPSEPYPYGEAQEGFSNITTGPYPESAPEPNGPGGPSTWPTGANIVDTIGYLTETDMAATYGWTSSTLVLAFDQKFVCLEQSAALSTPLDPTYHVQNEYQAATRD